MDLHHAISAGDFLAVSALIGSGADLSAPDGQGSTPLMRAVERGHTPILRMLMAAGAEYDGTENQWHTALRAAARRGHRRVFETLRAKVPLARQKAAERILQTRDPQPEKADPRVGRLVAAATAGRVEEVRRLIAQGTDVNRADRSLKLPLVSAAGNGHTNVVVELLKAGADTEARQYLVTPLWAAADRGHLEVVKALLAAGALLDSATLSRETALHRALANGHIEVARCLVRAGAALGFDTKDTRILELAQKLGDAELNKLIAARGTRSTMVAFVQLMDSARRGDLAGVDAALRQGGPVGLMEDRERNALAEAAAAGQIVVVRRLLAVELPAALRAQVLARALVISLEKGQIDAARALVQAGVDVNMPDGVIPRTPLSVAVESGRLDIVRLMLNSGADPNRDVHGISALDCAIGKPEIRDLLKAWDAKRTTDGVPLSQLRGVLSLDVDELWLAVRAEVAEAASAFAAIRKAKRVHENVYGRPITVARRGFVAFRLRGHDWTLIVTWGDDQSKPSTKHWLAPGDAQAIAKRLVTQAVFFAVSDTGGGLAYNLYEDGKLLERFETGQDDVLIFESTLRKLTQRQLRNKEKTLNLTFTDLGLLIYSMGNVQISEADPGRTAPIYLPGLDDDDVERLDYIELV
jgi:ankyrin repeat protein